MRQGLLYGTVPVRPSVCPIYRPLQQRAASLLLGAPRAGDIDQLLQQARRAASAGHRAATAPQQHGTQQHGVQQQMREVSRLQPP